MSSIARIFPDGEMAARLRERGVFDAASPAVRAALTVCLAAPTAMLLWSGPELSLAYNDAAIPLVADAHPAALGRTTPNESDERWRSIRADLERVMNARATVHTDHFVLTPVLDGDDVVAIIGTSTHPHDDIMAVLGHELRSPLSAMSTMVQALLLRSPTAEMQLIERALHKLTDILDDVRDSSRLARRKLKLDKTVVELSQIVQDAVERARLVLDDHRAKVAVRVPRGGYRVEVDPMRTARAIAIVIGDVANRVSSGSTIAIEVSRGADHVSLRVYEEQAKSQRAADSAGLSFSIARTVIDLHGGTLAARSGTDYEITLPATNASVVAAQATLAPSRRRVLLVEDNDEQARALKGALEQLGYEVALAHDAPIALNLVRTFQPHVALLDLALPVMDGWELARRIQEVGRELPVIAVTAKDDDAGRQRSADLGFAEHLVKPVDLPRLQKLVDDLSASQDQSVPPSGS
jgi:CheY-like chemotaxis protein/signal transduction histidine kinase